MIQEYKGEYEYKENIISNWKSTSIGVYYCGFKSIKGVFSVLYVGRATGDHGIRGRLLEHLQENKWPDVSHFGYCICSTSKEAEDYESSEIKRLKPKYNIQGKYYN